MFDRFFMTKHFITQYAKRLNVKETDVKRMVNYDLSVKMVKRIVDIGNQRHVFTRNSREFIFKKDQSKGTWRSITVIKHSKLDIDKTIDKRLRDQKAFKEAQNV